MAKELSLNILEIARKVKKLEESGGSGGGGAADDVTYDNTASHLDATNVQDAIDEVSGEIAGLSADDVSYDGTDSGLSAVTVQSAIDDTVNKIDTLKASDIMLSDGVTSVEDALDGRTLHQKLLTIPASTASGVTGWYYGYVEYSASVIPASAFILNAYSMYDAIAIPTMANVTIRPNNIVRVSCVTAHNDSSVAVILGWVDDFISE